MTLDLLTSDAVILASMAVQYDAGLAVSRHALKRTPSGITASLICAALDQIR